MPVFAVTLTQSFYETRVVVEHATVLVKAADAEWAEVVVRSLLDEYELDNVACCEWEEVSSEGLDSELRLSPEVESVAFHAASAEGFLTLPAGEDVSGAVGADADDEPVAEYDFATADIATDASVIMEEMLMPELASLKFHYCAPSVCRHCHADLTQPGAVVVNGLHYACVDGGRLVLPTTLLTLVDAAPEAVCMSCAYPVPIDTCVAL